MKRRFLLTCLFLFFLVFFIFEGCATTEVSIKNEKTMGELAELVQNRFAVVRAYNDSEIISSSAVSMGNGFFLTTYHSLIHKENNMVLPFYVRRGILCDTIPYFISRENDMALFWSSIGITDSILTPRFNVNIGEQVSWVQPIFHSNENLEIFFHVERISKTDSLRVFVDRPVFPGTSGSGLFDMNGNIIGIIDKLYYPHRDQVTYGSAIKIDLLEVIMRNIDNSYNLIK
ncbi:MAG: hypothetical protein WCV80_02665 [Candidatus Paceibacterota bacterium]|jgi:hypothetical protein